MKKRWLGFALCLALALAGCDRLPAELLPAQPGGFRPYAVEQGDRESARALDAQLGLLTERVSAEERQACEVIWDELYPIRLGRIERNEYRRTDREERLIRRLNKLLEQYTKQYLDGDDIGFGYENPEEQEVAAFAIGSDGAIESPGKGVGGDWAEGDLAAMWDDIKGILPADAFRDFGRFDVFTDGPSEMLAYVYPMDAKGARWVIAVDPEDAGDGELFTETILHEYAHYLTLNNTQAEYGSRQTADTYNEDGMVSFAGSYMDDFYQTFWTDYIDDCLACDDTYNFFLRHEYDFVSDYASTNPAEDIAESFTYFVLWDRWAAQDVWEEKIVFFYDYPELVAFRTVVRENLGLSEA